MKYICSICHSSTNASFNYNSIKTVLLHIIEDHPEIFHYHLSDITANQEFILCKICRSFISLDRRSSSEKSRQRKELAHYLNNHGQVFLYSFGVLSVTHSDLLACNLCLQSTQSYEHLCEHLLSEHAQDIIQRFRYFDLSQLASAPAPSVCCICRAQDSSPEHLASHNKEILIKIGLIEVNDLKIVCKCCQSVSVHISRILSHFSTEHKHLYRFLTLKYLEFTSVTKNEANRNGNIPDSPDPALRSLQVVSSQPTKVKEFLQEEIPMTTVSQSNYSDSDVKASNSTLCPSDERSAITQNKPQNIVIKPEQVLEHEPQLAPSVSQPLQVVSGFQQLLAQNVMKKPGSGFENAFLSFVGSSAHPATIHHEGDQVSPLPTNVSTSNVTPRSAVDLSNVKMVHRIRKNDRKSKQAECFDVCCRICDKPFDRVDKKGLIKSNGRVKVEINAHYLLHFRDQLMSKYPSSFTGPIPYRCEKCGHFSRTENTNSMKNLMLTHIASCQGELETLIGDIPRRDQPIGGGTHPSPSHNPVSVNLAPSWRQSSVCLVCDGNITDTIRNYHYAGHFKQKMIDRFVTDKQSFKCPLCSLEMVENNDFALLKFLIHLGDVHDIFSEMIAVLSPAKSTVVPISNGVHNKENKFQSQQFHSQSQQQPYSQLAKKSVNSMQNFSSFLKHQEQHPKCLKCYQEADSLKILMRHLLRKHYTNDINNDIIEFFPNFYDQEVVQGEVKCKKCSEIFPANRSLVTDHIGVDHMDVIKLYFNDVKNDFITFKLKQDVCEEEELDTEMVLTSLLEDIDKHSGEEVERRENENLAKIQDYLGKVKETRKIFVQMAPCYLIDPDLSPCHECKKILSENAQNVNQGSCCCFEGFRKLKYSISDSLLVAGYLNPVKDPKQADIDNWSLESVGESQVSEVYHSVYRE